jgi:hypothetical protein
MKNPLKFGPIILALLLMAFWLENIAEAISFPTTPIDILLANSNRKFEVQTKASKGEIDIFKVPAMPAVTIIGDSEDGKISFHAMVGGGNLEGVKLQASHFEFELTDESGRLRIDFNDEQTITSFTFFPRAKKKKAMPGISCQVVLESLAPSMGMKVI